MTTRWWADGSPASTTEVAGGSYDVVAIAASAGGVAALGRVLSGLAVGFPVPVLVVQHLDPKHETILADVLGRRTQLPVSLAAGGAIAQPGAVYVAPPNHHLLVTSRGRLALSDSEVVHFVRPSADRLFESVAGAYGSSAIACVLTGSGVDGATGAAVVKSRGGTVIVEDPEFAEFKGMPEATVAAGAVDYVVPLDEIAGVINELVGRVKES